MNEKKLLIILAVVVIGILILGIKLVSGPSSSTSAITGTSAGNEQISLETNPNPPSLGKTTLVINVKDEKGKAVDNAKVSFDLNMTTMNMGKQQGSATSQGNGKYAAVGNLSMRGPWRVSTTVIMPGGTKMNKDFVVNAQ